MYINVIRKFELNKDEHFLDSEEIIENDCFIEENEENFINENKNEFFQ